MSRTSQLMASSMNDVAGSRRGGQRATVALASRSLYSGNERKSATSKRLAASAARARTASSARCVWRAFSVSRATRVPEPFSRARARCRASRACSCASPLALMMTSGAASAACSSAGAKASVSTKGGMSWMAALRRAGNCSFRRSEKAKHRLLCRNCRLCMSSWTRRAEDEESAAPRGPGSA